jgi:LEA14-like dessication related protein
MPTAQTPRSFWRRWKPLLFAALALGVALAASILALGAYMRGGVEVAVVDISIARQDSANAGAAGKVFESIVGAAKAAMGKGDVLARLKVRNNTSLSVYITAARYSVFIGDNEIGKGSWVATEGAPAAFRSREDVTLDLPIRLDNRSAFASLVESLQGKDASFRVEGDLTMSLALYSVTVPFKADYIQIDLPRDKTPSY